MKHIDLFSGIGGFALAASRVWSGHEIVTFCEKDKYCQKVLKKHWPDTPICEDIYELKGQKCDLITGGFPCQPFSTAGKQRGTDDDRYLWPEMLRIIREAQPTWVVGENVAGIVNMALDQVLIDLEMEGYACQCFIIPACGVDAPHRRNRVWIVANSIYSSERQHKSEIRQECREHVRSESSNICEKFSANRNVADTESQSSNVSNNQPRCKIPQPRDGSSENWRDWEPEPNVGRVANGIPSRVDRLRALGNAIVPAVAEEIFRAIYLSSPLSTPEHQDTQTKPRL